MNNQGRPAQPPPVRHHPLFLHRAGRNPVAAAPFSPLWEQRNLPVFFFYLKLLSTNLLPAPSLQVSFIKRQIILQFNILQFIVLQRPEPFHLFSSESTAILYLLHCRENSSSLIPVATNTLNFIFLNGASSLTSAGRSNISRPGITVAHDQSGME